MGRSTNILWTKSTLNLAWGCTKVTQECKNCYMYRMSPSFGRDPYKVEILGKFRPETWEYRFIYLEQKIKSMDDLIFVNSMSDSFHKDIPDFLLDIWFKAFEGHPEKQFQVLTKRPERALQYFQSRNVPENVWIGTSCGIKAALPRIDILKQIKARIRFVSVEPLLEDLGDYDFTGVQWVIIGGESDQSSPRPMKVEWVDNLVPQVRKAGAALFFKQNGGIGGDNAGGCLYHGKEIKEFPK